MRERVDKRTPFDEDDPVGVQVELGGFPSSDRFEPRQRLGSGGMGTVWAAWDRERGVEVALKTLHMSEPEGIYRFKREFRALADVTHPNLVTLHELFASEGEWFFTMELLEGSDFIRHVRGDRPAAPGPSTTGDETTLAARAATPDEAAAVPQSVEVSALPDLNRLRAAAEQLVEGVVVLHAAGWLHRDIKPSNVMVTSAGRVVLLDFGVVAEMGGRGARAHADTSVGAPLRVIGTPSFMSPEQARGESVGPESDWYSVGLLLYQALAGRRAFAGRGPRVLEDKQTVTPPPLRVHCPDVPRELDELCVALLDREPSARPGGRDILSVLRRGRRSSLPPLSLPPPGDDDVPVIGRAGQLKTLRDALERARSGLPEVVLVHGTSGTGKTTLIARFLADVTQRERAVVLAGRCYERESVPYKAVDSVVDELAGLLMGLPAPEVRGYLPPDTDVLVQVFPALRRVGEIAALPARRAGTEDLPEVRRRAFGALREMLRRLAQRGPLVVFVDDMQWGDADSAPLLEALVRPPDAPALLLLGSYRTDERDRSALLRALLEGHGGIARSHRDLPVGPLAIEDAEALAAHLLARARGDASAAPAIARESDGNPYFVHELVRFARVAGAERGAGVGLEDLIGARVEKLGERDRHLLEVIAVAGKPLAQRVAHEAAGIGPADRHALVHHLGSSQLVRTSGPREGDAVECYHDRIRETVVAGLSPDSLGRWHLRIAQALEAHGGADPETLAEHLHAAGQYERAAAYAVEAAEHAAASLSFLHAATLFELALRLRPAAPPEEIRSLRARLGEALANAGRGADSARAFVEAAAVATDPSEVHELRRLAGEQYLRAGYVTEGLAIVRELLQELGIRFPASGAETIASLLAHRAALRLQGVRFVERDPAEVSELQRMRADIFLTTSTGLVQLDAPLGGLFATRAVRESLRTGDRHRVGRALIIEALMLSSAGARARRATARFLALAESIVPPAERASFHALLLAGRGISALELGDFSDSFETCERALEAFRRDATGSFWELGNTELFSALAQLWGAKFDAVARLTPGRVSAAEERGDLYTVTCLRAAITPILHLMADEPEAARREGDRALALWRIPDFQNQHYMAFVAQSFTDLYTGDVDAAVRRCDVTAAHMKRSLLKHVQVIRATWRQTEGLCLLAAAARHPGRAGPWLRRVRRNARRLSREGAAWCDGAAAQLTAGLALRASDRRRALAQLERARERFDRCGMGLFGESCDWRIATLTGGAAAAARAREVEERWGARGAVRPRRMLEAVSVPP